MNGKHDANEKLTEFVSVLEDTIRDLPASLGQEVLIHELSKPERRAKEREIAKAWKRKHRKKYTRKPGRVHPKKKAATKRRRLRKMWRENPFACYIYGYGAHVVDKDKWDEYIAPLWERYDPEKLQVVKYKRTYSGEYVGTVKHPYTVYTIDVVHKDYGLLYSGRDQELFDLSRPSSL